MAQYNDLSRDDKGLANRLYSVAMSAVGRPGFHGHFPNCGYTGEVGGPSCNCSVASSRLMQAMVDEVAELAKKADPEYQQFLRLREKFPHG